MQDLMLDIETMSTDSNAVVLSISAVQFDYFTGEIGKEFEMGLQTKQQVDKGAVVDIETALWWTEQSDEARSQLNSLPKELEGKVLAEFNIFCEESNPTRVWGNGAGFDNVVVRNLYTRFNKIWNIPFWKDTDVRTVVSIFNIDKRDFEFKGTPHRGIDDCKFQIEYITAANKANLPKEELKDVK